jgi:hypothetical protein
MLNNKFWSLKSRLNKNNYKPILKDLLKIAHSFNRKVLNQIKKQIFYYKNKKIIIKYKKINILINQWLRNYFIINLLVLVRKLLKIENHKNKYWGCKETNMTQQYFRENKQDKV